MSTIENFEIINVNSLTPQFIEEVFFYTKQVVGDDFEIEKTLKTLFFSTINKSPNGLVMTTIQQETRELQLIWISVEKPWQRQGIGTALLWETIKEVQKLGFEYLNIIVPENTEEEEEKPNKRMKRDCNNLKEIQENNPFDFFVGFANKFKIIYSTESEDPTEEEIHHKITYFLPPRLEEK